MILIISVPLKDAFQMVNFSFETLLCDTERRIALQIMFQAPPYLHYLKNECIYIPQILYSKTTEVEHIIIWIPTLSTNKIPI
jgi:hypothetical protein